MVDSPQDRVSPKSQPPTAADFIVDSLTPRDNNVTHRNYQDLETSTSRRFSERFFVRNPTDEIIRTVLRLSSPADFNVKLDRFPFNEPFTLKPGQEILVAATMVAPELNSEGEVSIIQELDDPRRVMGGVTFRLRPTAVIEPRPVDSAKLRLLESFEDLLRRQSNLTLRLGQLIVELKNSGAASNADLITLTKHFERLIAAQAELNRQFGTMVEAVPDSSDSEPGDQSIAF